MEVREIFLFLLLLADYSIAGETACKTTCIGTAGNVVKLKPGTTYVYNLEGETQTTVPKTSNNDVANLNIRAKAEVSAQTDCQVLISLKSVEVTGNKKYSNLAKLEENPLKVSLNGGLLSPDVCVVPEDDYTSLNIKRAVASLLQISAAEPSTVSETDVFGTCPTNYNVRKDGDSTTVTKQRDLNKCAYRESVRQDVFTIPHSGSSIFQSSPLLDPSYDAEIKVKDGVVQSAVVRESYLVRPFSDRDNGARTRVTTKLTLESKTSSAATDSTQERRSVIFENPHETVTSTIQTVLNALHKVVDGSDNAVGEGVARDFSELIAIIRRASADDLLSVYGQVKAGAGFKNKHLARKAFVQALFRSGSGDSVSVAVELLKNKEIEGEWARLWFLSFAFVRHASVKSLEKAASLLDEPNLPREAYLGVGALAGRYCREHNCNNVPALSTLLKKLSAPLTNLVPTSRTEENKIVGSLKSLRNVRKLDEETSTRVAAAIKETRAPNRVRAAALETGQSYPCCQKIRKAAYDVLENREEDSELRIKAYLTLVECPNHSDTEKLSALLKNENVNQVGAFITSHLRNLEASANPDHQAAKQIFRNVVHKRYPVDIRKFSQNYEISYDIDSLSTAASAEANVIFSQKSYLPRSINLNVTTEVFGHAFNLFELSGRAENLERVLEKYVGPKGYLRNTRPEDLIKEGKSEVGNLLNLLEEKYKRLSRSKRATDVRTKTQDFAKKVKLFPSELDNNVDVDLSLRLLGNELLWVNLGENDRLTPQDVIEQLSNILERSFRKAKDFDYNIQNHALFLDTELAYPTAVGLAVKLSARGTSVAHLKLAGNADLGALLKDPNNGQLKFELRPSASVDVIGQLSVDGYAVESGVRLSGQLHTATGTEVSIKLLDGKGVDVHLGLPVKKSDILTIKSEVMTVTRERGQLGVGKKVEFAIPKKDFQGCFDQLQPVIGLTLCGELALPNDQQPLTSGAALYPLNGQSKISVRLDKEDESLTSYHFRAFYDIHDPKHRKVELLVETPGSKIPREISLLAEVKTEPTKEVNVKLITPIYKVRAEGKVVDTDKEYSLSGLVRLDDATEYRARVGLLINGAVYTPVMEVLHDKNNLLNVKVEGSVEVEKAANRKKYIFHNVRVGSGQSLYSVDGSIITDSNLYQNDLKLGFGTNSIELRSKVQRQGDNNLKVQVEFKPLQQPDLSFALKYEYQLDPHHLENSLVIVHGADLNSKEAKISVFQQVNFKIESIHQFDISTKNTINYPLVGLDGKFEGAATQKSVSYDFSGALNKNQISSKLSAKTGIRKPGDYEIDFQFNGFSRGVRVELGRQVISLKKSKFTNQLTLNPGGKYSVAADVTHQLERGNIDAGIVATITAPNVVSPYILDTALLVNPTNYAAHVKVTSSGSDILDTDVRQQRSETSSTGSFRVNIKNAIESSGQYKQEGGKANGDVSINLIPLKRKIKSTADLAVKEQKYTGIIEVLYDADRDVSKKLLIDTDTDLTRRSIKSKNKLTLNGKELQVNFNGEAQGKPGNGALNGGYDITLPAGQHFVARFENSINLQPQQSKGEVFADIGYSLSKGTPLTKLTFNTKASNVDLKRYAFDVKQEIRLVCESGDVFWTQSLKSVPHDGKWQIDGQNAVGGSRLGEYQFNGKLKASLSLNEITQHTTATLGEKASFNSESKWLVEGRTRVFENSFNGKVAGQTAKLVEKWRFTEGQGKEPCQFVTSGEAYLNDVGVAGSGEGSLGVKEGNVKFVMTPKGLSGVLKSNDDPIKGEIRYKHAQAANELRKSEVSVSTDLGAGRYLNTELKANYHKDLSVLNSQFTWSSKVNTEKKASVAVNYKRVSTAVHTGDVKVAYDNYNWDLNGKLDATLNRPSVDVNAIINGAKNRYYFKIDRKSDRHSTAESQAIWSSYGGGQFDTSVVSDFDSPENFLLSLKMNSEKLNINKVKIELSNKPNKAGTANRVNFVAQYGDKKGVSGSANYVFKQTENGYTIEGKGNANVNGENHPLSYKIAANDSPLNQNGKIQVDFTKGSFSLEGKSQPSELVSSVKFCLVKECFESGLEVHRQLTELPIKHSFNYKFLNTFGGRSDNVQLSQKAEYGANGFDIKDELAIQEFNAQLHQYITSRNAGVVLTLPSREVAAVAEYQLPSSKGDQNLKIEASFYPDRKKAPADKSTVLVKGGVKDTTVSGEARFSHPKLSRDLSAVLEASYTPKNHLKGKVEFDVLAKKSQKLSLSVELIHDVVHGGHNVSAKTVLNSKGLTLDIGGSGHAFFSNKAASFGTFAYYVDAKNLKKDAGVLFEANYEKLFALVKVPDREIVNLDGKLNLAGDTKTIDVQLTLVEGETAILNVKAVGLKELSACLHPKSAPNRKLTGVVKLTPEKLEGIAERVENGKTELLAKGSVRFDKGNLFKIDYDVEAANIRKSIKYFQITGEDVAKRFDEMVKHLIDEISKELQTLVDVLRHARPDLAPVIRSYQEALEAFKKEVENDPTLSKVHSILTALVKVPLEAALRFAKAVEHFVEDVQKKVEIIARNTQEFYKKIEPNLKEISATLVKLFTELSKIGTEVLSTTIDVIADTIKRNQKDIKIILDSIADSFQEIGQAGITTFNQLREELRDIVNILIDQLKSLPIVSETQDRIKELINLEFPAHFWELYNEFASTVQDFLPTPELKQLVKTIFSYVEKLLRKQQVNNEAELKTLSEQALAVFNSCVRQLKELIGADKTVGLLGLNLKLPLPAATVLKLPELGRIQFSPINLLSKAASLPNPIELYRAYRPTLNPFDLVPPFRAYGLIMNSHHFITFDRRHFAFKGSCSYILAQDFLDGNFTLVANLDNGKLKSITLADAADTVELLSDNTVVVNGKAGDLPVRQGDISAWRRYNSANLRLKSSVYVTRLLPSDIYIIRVSGFYFGRTRGLLGTISNEQYDEYQLPNGKTTENSATAANAYKLDASCADVPEMKHDHGAHGAHGAHGMHHKECENFFESYESPLRYGFLAVSPAPFHEACDQHVAMMPSDAKKAACDVAAAYVATLREEYQLFASLPAECAQCTINGKKVELGQTEEVKPSNKADVVLVLEQSSHNEVIFSELVTPLITTLTTDLKEKGITDTEFSLIGYGSAKQRWPQHYSNNGKVTYAGKPDGIVFSNPEKLSPPYDTLLKKYKLAWKFIKIELGWEQIVIAMSEANAYPFREGAVRIIVLINSTPCSRGPLFPLSLQIPRTISIYQYYQENVLNFYQIAPLAGLSHNKPELKPKTIVGFDRERIYHTSDAKQLKGETAGRSELVYEDDLCVSFSQVYGNAAFSSQNFLDSKPDQRKKFVEVVSQRIVKDAAKKEIADECICALKDGIFPQTQCSSSGRWR